MMYCQYYKAASYPNYKQVSSLRTVADSAGNFEKADFQISII